MAILSNSDGTITITNGDVEIVKQIQREFDIKSIEDTLAFILQVSKTAEGQPIGFRKEDGAWVGFRPNPTVRAASEHRSPPSQP